MHGRACFKLRSILFQSPPDIFLFVLVELVLDSPGTGSTNICPGFLQVASQELRRSPLLSMSFFFFQWTESGRPFLCLGLFIFFAIIHICLGKHCIGASFPGFALLVILGVILGKSLMLLLHCNFLFKCHNLASVLHFLRPEKTFASSVAIT